MSVLPEGGPKGWVHQLTCGACNERNVTMIMVVMMIMVVVMVMNDDDCGRGDDSEGIDQVCHLIWCFHNHLVITSWTLLLDAPLQVTLMSTHTSLHPSSHTSCHSSTRTSRKSRHSSTHTSRHLFTHTSCHPSTHTSCHPSIHMSRHPSIYMSHPPRHHCPALLRPSLHLRLPRLQPVPLSVL